MCTLQKYRFLGSSYEEGAGIHNVNIRDQSFVPNKKNGLSAVWFLSGDPSGARTLDTLIKSQVLYQLS